MLPALAKKRDPSIRSGIECSLRSRKKSSLMGAWSSLREESIARCAREEKRSFAPLRDRMLAALAEESIARSAREEKRSFAPLRDRMLSTLAEESIARSARGRRVPCQEPVSSLREDIKACFAHTLTSLPFSTSPSSHSATPANSNPSKFSGSLSSARLKN
jgi:hypothetical protein